MRRRYSLFLAIHLFVAPLLCGQAFGGTNDLWFDVGEEFSYRLYWGILPVGDANVTTAWVQENGTNYIALRATAKTGSIVSQIYPVDDFFETIVDPVTFMPVRYTQKMREGKRIRNETTEFDYPAHLARWKSALSADTTNITIDADTRDVISLVYCMRAKGFQAEQTEKFRVLVDEKLYDLTVTGLKNEEVYLSRFGKVDCLKLEPKAKFGEIFVRKGTMNVWFSTDKRHVWTKAEASLPVCNLRAILRTVRGPGAGSWPAKKDKSVETGAGSGKEERKEPPASR